MLLCIGLAEGCLFLAHLGGPPRRRLGEQQNRQDDHSHALYIRIETHLGVSSGFLWVMELWVIFRHLPHQPFPLNYFIILKGLYAMNP